MMRGIGKWLGMKRRNVEPKRSRIDRRKTRTYPVDLLDDSDEGSYHSTTSVSSESEFQSSDDGSDTSDSSNPKRKSSEDGSENDDKNVRSRQAQRKRSSASTTVLDDSSSDSESDVGAEPLRKVLQRKRLKLVDSEDEAAEEKKRESEVREAAAKRRERKNKLMELLERRKSGPSRKRRRTLGSEEDEKEKEVKVEEVKEAEQKKEEESENDSSDDEEEDAAVEVNSSEEERQADSDSLKDFIVDDEEEKTGEKEEEGTTEKSYLSQLPRQFITGSHKTHFQVVVKALLINVLDETFLESLYSGERNKRYAQEMKSSLHHFDERLVLPRLENLRQRSRWKDRYKERVECYPKLSVVMTGVRNKVCEACELHRTTRYSVRLSGQLYDTDTLQEDKFMPDDRQSFFVGSVCASRTEVYHTLKHFKYRLFERCRKALETERKEQEEEEGDAAEEEPVKDTVNKVFTKLEEAGWISKQFEEFQEHLNAADFFQDEKLD
ncbi:coiled-coil domain-containing protein 82 [Chanos chanos]|uniref:Coiled-coil domain-containing protein 82 n=1 Tax=Chanos chanos TaxID=29144 RepID=A0A6J2W385_CHACN|nr:coiled-coil domain-containing protein 82 [Chanos chanos]